MTLTAPQAASRTTIANALNATNSLISSLDTFKSQIAADNGGSANNEWIMLDAMQTSLKASAKQLQDYIDEANDLGAMPSS